MHFFFHASIFRYRFLGFSCAHLVSLPSDGEVSHLCSYCNLKKRLARYVYLTDCWLWLQSDHTLRLEAPGHTRPAAWPRLCRAERGAWGRRLSLTCLLQGNQHRLLDEVSLYEAAEVFTVHGEVWKLEGTDGHFQGVLTAPPTPTIGGDMGPGQGNNAGAGVGDAPRQAFFCNEKRSHLRTYTAHSELSTHVEDFQSGENGESHWLPNFTILFLKPNTVGEIASGIFAGTHVSTKYSFLSPLFGICPNFFSPWLFPLPFPSMIGTHLLGSLVIVCREEEEIWGFVWLDRLK